MLENLHVKNITLIEEADVDFGPGLNILTGETGAGKSLLLGAIYLAIGARGQKNLLRQGADYALAELTFHAEDARIDALFEELGFEPADGEIILTRKLGANGRSQCRVNGETVSASTLQRVASYLIDIHGQHEHESLLVPGNHMRILDEYAKDEIGDKKNVTGKLYHQLQEKKKELDGMALDDEKRLREQEFLRFEINEIEEAGLSPGEDVQLEEEYRILSNGQRILDALYETQRLCAQGQESAVDHIGQSVHALRSIADYDAELAPLLTQAQEIESLFEDFNRDLSRKLDSYDFSEERLNEVHSRLNLINHLKAKYGRTIEQILKARDERKEKEQRLTDYESYVSGLQEEIDALQEELASACRELTRIRSRFADELSARITKSLEELNFLKVQFSIDLIEKEEPGADGADTVRFMISTNPGEPLKPLDQVASGGELSRIMLAIKTVLAQTYAIDALVFDEIDAGISGRTAQMVAQKLRQTAQAHQIICITHLPQIASMASEHFLIEKHAEDEHTLSSIRRLDTEESIRELARMLGGVKIGDAAYENARELKEQAQLIQD